MCIYIYDYVDMINTFLALNNEASEGLINLTEGMIM